MARLATWRVFGVGGDGRCGHYGVDNVEGGSVFLFYRRELHGVGFKLAGEVSVQSSVCLGVWRLSGVWEANEEVGRCNLSTRLRNRPFSNSVQALIGVVGVSDPVSVYL